VLAAVAAVVLGLWWPVAAPGGAHVAFTKVYSQHMELDVLDVHSHRLVRLGSNAGQLFPTWSADGSHLAYASGGMLYVANADGSGKRRYLAPTKAFAPAWRPGGTELAYLTTHGARNTDLWVGNALWARDAIGRPAWSPDGASIAFQRDEGIFVATGPGAETRVSYIANPGQPAWSPDGGSIAYTAGHALYVLPADRATEPRRLVSNLLNPGPPSWSPDGTEVAVSSGGGVWIATLHGARYRVDTQARVFGVGTSWIGPSLLISAAVRGCSERTGIVQVRPTRSSAVLPGSCPVP
jgi:Tol biopolymer transport system component